MYSAKLGNTLWRQMVGMFHAYRLRRGMVFGAIIIGALLAFELFNYTTTDFALTDLLGDMRFLELRWATILSLAFCGMDFAGIARLFTPERGQGNHLEVWYLLGAWLLAATMNATLTWWGVSIALLSHTSLGNEILSRQELLDIVPVFVAVLVWLIRILMIGTFSLAGDRLFSQADATMRREVDTYRGLRPVAAPAPKAISRPARTIGAYDDEDEEFDQRPRPSPAPAPMYRPPVAPARPVSPMPVVRPAPKPSASMAPKYPVPSGGNGGGYRPAPLRASEPGARGGHDRS